MSGTPPRLGDLTEARLTHPNVRRDFVEWHRGRSRFAFWAIDCDRPEIRERMAAAGRHLDRFLLAGYLRQAHLTLCVCGFPALQRILADDYMPEDVERQLDALQRARVAPFEVEVGGLGSSACGPYLCVGDPSGGLTALRGCLDSSAPYDHEPGYRFNPHVAVGLYAEAWPAQAVCERIAVFNDDVMTFRVARLSLMSYDASDIAGPLSILAEYDLSSARMSWRLPFVP